MPARKLEQDLKEFTEHCPHPSDELFKLHVFSKRDAAHGHRRISAGWSPTRKTREELSALGYRPEMVEGAVADFVMATLESNTVPVDIDAAFKAYLGRRYSLKRGAKPLSSANWNYLVSIGIPPAMVKHALEVLEGLYNEPLEGIPEDVLIEHIHSIVT